MKSKSSNYNDISILCTKERERERSGKEGDGERVRGQGKRKGSESGRQMKRERGRERERREYARENRQTKTERQGQRQRTKTHHRVSKSTPILGLPSHHQNPSRQPQPPESARHRSRFHAPPYSERGSRRRRQERRARGGAKNLGQRRKNVWQPGGRARQVDPLPRLLRLASGCRSPHSRKNWRRSW